MPYSLDYLRLTDPALGGTLACTRHLPLDDAGDGPTMRALVGDPGELYGRDNSSDGAIASPRIDRQWAQATSAAEIQLGSGSSSDVSGTTFSVAMWVYGTSSSGPRPFASRWGASGNYGWWFGIRGGGGAQNQQIQIQLSADGTTISKSWYTTSAVFSSLAWRHVCLVVDFATAAIATLYVDGVPLPLTLATNNGGSSVHASATQLVIGNYGTASDTTRSFATFGDYMHWERALNAAEVRSLMQCWDVVDPTRDTYLGAYALESDIAAPLQLSLDRFWSTAHKAGHGANLVFPRGLFYLGQAVQVPYYDNAPALLGWSSSSPVTGTGPCTELRRSGTFSAGTEGDTLIQVASERCRIERIAFTGSTSTSSGNWVGQAIHYTRGSAGTGQSPTKLAVRNCSFRGFVAAIKVGWDQDENNCDWLVYEDNEHRYCRYLGHNGNDQGQMQHFRRNFGASGTTAQYYIEHGGPILIEHFGASGGAGDIVRTGVPEKNVGSVVMRWGKLDAQVPADIKVINQTADGWGHFVVQDLFSEPGRHGTESTNYAIVGKSHLSILNCVGMGKVACTAGSAAGGQGAEIPTILAFGCEYAEGVDGNFAIDVIADPLAALVGTGTLFRVACYAGTGNLGTGLFNPVSFPLPDYSPTRDSAESYDSVTVNPDAVGFGAVDLASFAPDDGKAVQFVVAAPTTRYGIEWEPGDVGVLTTVGATTKAHRLALRAEASA